MSPSELVSHPKVLVIIPAFNEERTIADVLGRLKLTTPEYDRIVINDGSKDRTGEIIVTLGEKQLIHPFNLGYGRALQLGLKYGLAKGYNIIISIDADGQHRPEDVEKLVQKMIQTRADLIIGSRFLDNRSYRTTVSRRFGQLIFSHLTRLLIGRRIFDTTSGFKGFSEKACKVIVDRTFMDFHIETIVRLSMFGMKIVEIPVDVNSRNFGRSMHSFSSVFQYPLKTILMTIVAVVDVLIERIEK